MGDAFSDAGSNDSIVAVDCIFSFLYKTKTFSPISGRPVRIKDISTRQGISVKYLEQIVSILNKAGFVRAIRGPQGGYQLVKPPEEYTAGMILRLTEGNLAPVSCLEFEENTCDRQDTCATLELWKRLKTAIDDVVDSVTLAQLVEWQQQKNDNYII